MSASSTVTISLTPLEALMRLPLDERAIALDDRMRSLDEVDRLHEHSYAERGLIAREFEQKQLWKWVTNPNTGEPFNSFSAWATSGSLACRRTVFEAKEDIKTLQKEIPPQTLREIPKWAIKTLIGCSPSILHDEKVLEAAKVDDDRLRTELQRYPNEHISNKALVRLNLEYAAREALEEAVGWAMSHNIAGTRSEAVQRMAEEAVRQWQMEEELDSLPTETEKYLQ